MVVLLTLMHVPLWLLVMLPVLKVRTLSHGIQQTIIGAHAVPRELRMHLRIQSEPETKNAKCTNLTMIEPKKEFLHGTVKVSLEINT